MVNKQRRVTPRLTGKRDHTAMEARREQALELLDAGTTQSEVSRQLGVSRQAVSKWVAMRREAGEDGIKSKGKPGRKTALTEAERTAVEVVLVGGPVKSGYRNDLWTLRRIATVIGKVTGRPAPSTTRTWVLLREMGWSCQRPAKRARQQNADAVAEFRTRIWTMVKKKPRKTAH